MCQKFLRRFVDKADGFPPEFWQFFLQSSLTALGGKTVGRLSWAWRGIGSLPRGLCDSGGGGRGWRRSVAR